MPDTRQGLPFEATCGSIMLLLATLCLSVPPAAASPASATCLQRGSHTGLPIFPLPLQQETALETVPPESFHPTAPPAPVASAAPPRPKAPPTSRLEPVLITMRRAVAVRRTFLVTVPRPPRHRSLASRGAHLSPLTRTVTRTCYELKTTNYDIAPLILRQADKHNLDPHLIKAVIKVESGFNNNATSWAGASGLMQLMPATGYWLGARNLYDPAENIAAGSKYLRTLLNHYSGNLELAVAAYNAGPGNVGQCVPNIPETRRYVVKVMSAYNSYKRQPGTQRASQQPRP